MSTRVGQSLSLPAGRRIWRPDSFAASFPPSLSIKEYLFMCMCVCLHPFMCAMGTRVPVEAKRQHWIPRNWNCGWFVPARYRAGTAEPPTSPASALSPFLFSAMSVFSLSLLIWVLGIELRSSCLYNEHSAQLSHLPALCLLLYWKDVSSASWRGGLKSARLDLWVPLGVYASLLAQSQLCPAASCHARPLPADVLYWPHEAALCPSCPLGPYAATSVWVPSSARRQHV